MSFEIITSKKETKYTILFDSDNGIEIKDNIIHAPVGRNKLEIKYIYKKVLKMAETSVELHLMSSPKVSKQDMYMMALNIISKYLMKNDIDIYLYLNTPYRFVNDRTLEKDYFSFFEEVKMPYTYSSSIQGNVLPSSAMPYFEEYALNQILLDNKDITFGERLVQLIDEKGYKKDSEVYRKAMIDRRLFHNIISKKDYQTRKNTAILLALALELNEEEAKDFLSYAGYAFSNTRKDLIILHCIRSHYYNVMYINAYLYDKGLNPLLNNEE